jgi:hypothetical protein
MTEHPPILPDDAKCAHCGYSLRGLQRNICPECAEPFVPGDAWSYDSKSKSPLLRKWNSPPRWWHAVLFITVTIFIVEGYSRPLGLVSLIYSLGIVSVALPPLIIWLVVSFALRVLANWQFRKHSQQVKRSRVGNARAIWITSSVCVFALLTPACFNWPLYGRFLLSMSAFETTMKYESTSSGKSWIGLYKTALGRPAGYAVFYTDHDIIASGPPWGFAYCPSPLPSPQPGAPRFRRHLLGDWYIWSLW